MSRKPSLRVPTHRLMHEGTVYAEIRCGKNKPAVKLTATGEVATSASFLLDCDLLMGRWHSALFYLFGRDASHIPDTAAMEPAL